ncbi:MAG: hypothetical protein P4L84_15640 [Isosphaeraceae bacterium]|nr:hypothetical protein [Isosphaeraceae bacterium]
MTEPTTDRGFHLLDLCALVIGYGLASLLVRAFWSSASEESAAVEVVIGLIYLWLGMAMSGPLVLARRRRTVARQGLYTWAELAWLIIGFYWIGMTILIVPIRLRHAHLIDAGLLGVFPFLAALGLRLLSPRRQDQAAETGRRNWTHAAAVVLLATWPIAWVALILLGKTLL